MKKNTDLKAKYQAAIAELEAKESEWKSLEEILRRAIGRLSIAGRGHDKTLDNQLKLIQELSRKRHDKNLPEALGKLADIVTSLDDNRPPSATKQDTETVPVLSDLLKGLQLDPEQQSDLENIGIELLKAIAENQDTKKIRHQLSKLSALIDENAGSDSPGNSATEIIYQFVSLLSIDEDSRVQLDQQFQSDTPVTNRELEKLAKIINAQISTAGQPGDSIAEAISSLLSKLSAVEGIAPSIGKLRSRLDKGVANGQWRGILDEVVTSISQTLDRLAKERRGLENIIVKVTEQISELSQFITANHDDHLSDHQDTLTLQLQMQEGVAKIEENVHSAEDIDQLKSAVTSNIELVREGVENFVERVNSRHEATEIRNEKLTKQISAMERESSQLQEKLKESSEKLLHDALTGVGSRIAYDEQIVQELARSKRYGSSFSFAILDIDHFKKINDKYGHNAGDNALKIIAGLMMSQIRKSDYVYRVGGEEFVLLVTNTELSSAETLVQKIRKSVAESGFHFKQEQVSLTLSAGITEAQEDDEVQTIYERADLALYRAKNSGRNCQIVG